MANRRLESNRVGDIGSTARPSRVGTLILIVLIMLAFLTTAWAGISDGIPFDFYGTLLSMITGAYKPSRHAIGILAVEWIVILVVTGLIAYWYAHHERGVGRRGETRVDRYAGSMGSGRAVEKVARDHAVEMASRLVKDYDPDSMAPGYPLGVNIVDGLPMATSWEDMSVVLAGPRSGKSLCYAIPACLSAPGALLCTSNKGDILDATLEQRTSISGTGNVWVFDPERIADPRKGASFCWNLIEDVREIRDAKRIADCWRYASGQPQVAGSDDFFAGTASQQLADYLYAAHLDNRTVSDVFKWASNENNSEPSDILKAAGYANLAARTASVIGLTPETRSGVFGSLQTMVAFLADPSVLDWIQPRKEESRPMFRPDVFVRDGTHPGTLYLLSAQGRPSTALTASLTATVAFTAYQYAQSECQDNNRRLPVPLCCVLDEAANICRWPELSDIYSYFGSAGIPIMTIWQNPSQGEAAFGATSFNSLFDNANVTVYLGGIKDTKFLGSISQLVGQREVVRSNVQTDHRGARSVSRSVQSEEILPVSRLAEWPVGRALVLASQARAQVVRTMPWNRDPKWAQYDRSAKRQEAQA
ncbi:MULTISPECIES: type IV secretory system conjugative DNA transfer family protein [Bifidobacterium]|uniref:type IV secretory system conjugative DNA transfer family protein n=1 Tax=Bifidobacterium TaxID=1678 RepID=UPI00264A0103|nr:MULTISPECIES: type IV secretory system conjugative DNA transfer family protein [Bifidobacterium]MDN5978674.1 TraM recognition domain-containing protein [Bifidobacterium mongoliense]MDN6016754.1 TraM recognition domain-containing protein [Bifidobacterium mongoliense]MDN6467703.1 TraM recognition domain-containing protein [Bifidobacterium crudilactis]MDN6558710.1 TraM recognition domain-containing protein [Bifidobacterium crudilactis]MDN6772661.1 TraM recognition domain-containing protein [Bi